MKDKCQVTAIALTLALLLTWGLVELIVRVF